MWIRRASGCPMTKMWRWMPRIAARKSWSCSRPGPSSTSSCLDNHNNSWTLSCQPNPPSTYFPSNSQNDILKFFNAAHVSPLLQTLQQLPVSLGGKAKVHKGPRPYPTRLLPLLKPLLPHHLLCVFPLLHPSSFPGLLTVPQTQGFSTSVLQIFGAGSFSVERRCPVRCIPALCPRHASSTCPPTQ